MTARPGLSAMTDKALVEVTRDIRQRRTAATARHERALRINAESEIEVLSAAKDIQFFDWALDLVAMEREVRDA